MMTRSNCSGRDWSRNALIAAYLGAGIIHLAYPAPFLRITPGWVPFAPQVIFVTGLCEIAGALALIPTRTRKLAGLALAAYAVCVYPANIKHAVDGLTAADASWMRLSYHVPRLMLQPVLVWWALHVGGWVRWPFGQPPEKTPDRDRQSGANDNITRQAGDGRKRRR